MDHGFAAALGQWRFDDRPLTTALSSAIADAVIDGRIPVGTRLPSERALAAMLRVSRGTVVTALERLRETGWLRTRHGSGSVIRLPPEATERVGPWSIERDGGLDLTLAVPAAPHAAYLEASRRAVERSAAVIVESGEAGAGLPRLRELLADRFTGEGLPTTPDQILVTSGARAAVMLLMDAFHERRRPVLAESPSFPLMLSILRRDRARLAAVPVAAGGWDAPLLERALTEVRPGIAYLIPDFQNPTGALMPAALRERIAASAERHGVTVIADETLRDLDLRAEPESFPHLAGRTVVSVGSMSKLVWGGLRVGWLRTSASRVRELLHNPLQAQLSPPPLEQLIACELLADPGPVLDERRRQLGRQRDHLAAALGDSADWSFDIPPGGLCLWLRLRDRSASAVAARAAEQGLALLPGPAFSADGSLGHHLRMPFTAAPDALTRAAAILRSAL